MNDPNLIADLIRAGVDADLVARVSNALISASCPPDIPVDSAAEKRRAYDRERKRKVRNVHRTSTGLPPDVHNQLYLSSLSLESKKEKKERGKSIPPDWHPSEWHYALGAKIGHSRAAVDEIATSMREWAEANKNRAVARKSDWDLTFNGFLRRQKPAFGQIRRSPIV